MREMNQGANNSDARLTEALRSMAAASATSAPPEIGDALAQAFRRHHARRRMVRRSAWLAALAMAIALPAIFLAFRKQPVESPGQTVTATAPNPPSAAPRAEVPPPATAKTSRLRGQKRQVTQRRSAIARRDDFVPLPAYDLRTQTEDLRIVRLRLNGRALRLVGAPVSAAIDDRAVLADFVVGQDGTPYAVRLLRQSTR
jgi:hypothetical protein